MTQEKDDSGIRPPSFATLGDDDRHRSASGLGDADPSWFPGKAIRFLGRLMKYVMLFGILYMIASLVLPWVLSIWFTRLISSQLGLHPAVESALGWVSFAIFNYIGFGFFRAGKSGHATWAWVILAVCGAMGINVLMHRTPSFAQRETYYVVTGHGPEYSDKPGIHPVVGRPYQRLTPEMRPLLERMTSTDRVRIDPDRSTLFHPWSGEPLAFTRQDSRTCEIEFYSAPGYDVHTRQWLEPVTPEIVAAYKNRDQLDGCQPKTPKSVNKEKNQNDNSSQ